MSDIVQVTHEGYVTLTLNRPERRNALTIETVEELTTAVVTASHDPAVKAVVITGAGQAFCAGADFSMLGELVDLAPEVIAQRVYASFQGAVRAIIEAEIPVIAAVNGPALGAGCDLALACDCRLVTPEARFEETWIKLGLLPGMGGLALLPPLVGLGTARAMLYRAESINGPRARQIGLAEALTDGQSLDALVTEWLAPLLRADRTALSWTKRGTRRAALRFLEDDLDFVSSRQGMRIASEEVSARLRALAPGIMKVSP